VVDDAPPAAPAMVLQWAQEHGEVGGVLTSHRQLTAQLRAAGRDVRYVDTGSARRAVSAVPALWHRRSLHLFHITRLARAMALAPLFALLPGRTVLVLHSGSVRGQLEAMGGVRGAALRFALRAYDEIWAVNNEIATCLPTGVAQRLRVVAPYSSEPVTDQQAPQRDPQLLSVSTNAGLAHYNADLAVAAVGLIRDEWRDARLRILAYGHDGPELAVLRAEVADLPWVELSFDAGPAEVLEVLRHSSVFLRPTAWDGDSVVVREALAAGTRVVASDVAARPAGVELAGLDAPAIAEAVLRGGRVSDGSGLSGTSLFAAAGDSLATLDAAG
jgi:glycosyltransferase involved in cell wall biosynthesis